MSDPLCQANVDRLMLPATGFQRHAYRLYPFRDQFERKCRPAKRQNSYPLTTSGKTIHDFILAEAGSNVLVDFKLPGRDDKTNANISDLGNLGQQELFIEAPGLNYYAWRQA